MTSMFLFLLSLSLNNHCRAEDILKQREPPARANECDNCHGQKSLRFRPGVKVVSRQHQDIELKHGNKEISCNSCHDINNHNYLYSAKAPKDFSHSSETCQTCHAEEYKSWMTGIHGKRSGGWRNDQTKYNCVDCHNPHRVSFPKAKAQPPPPKPKFAIPKHESRNQE